MHAAAMERILAEHVRYEHEFDFDNTLRTMTDDCYQHHVNLHWHILGQQGVRHYYESLLGAFPDLRGDRDGGTAYGESIIGYWGSLRGTMTGEWLGVPPSNRSLDIPYSLVLEFRDDRLVGETCHYDVGEMCDQLGLDREELIRAARMDSASWSH